MAHTENQKKLLKILNEIFQLDQSDLDFGIYRIMNTKSKEINAFLENDLISSVTNAFSSSDNSSLQQELDDKIKSFREDSFTEEQIENNTKIKALREQLSSTSSSNLENDVFSHLANFFKRYYKDGDFVSLRRYKKDTYAIPYEGEEVKLHWANSDQYYIKSGEYFRDYTFKVDGKTIHLKLSDAETEQNNNKATTDKERRFVILEDTPCEVINGELFINFEYKAIGKENQDKLNESAIEKALESITDLEYINALNQPAPTEKNKNRTIFEKHLKSYTSRNSFDYFIHKDLGGFLSRELDFYIKNEMLFLDDIMNSSIKYEEVMGKVKIFKEVASKIIAFLTQLEELQKKLWEKKKFIIETNYCITLDKIDLDHYDEIFACEEQKQEWKELFGVDIKSVDELNNEPYLVLDTKFFDTKFKYKLLTEFDNLDEEIDGVLINSENFGALNLLQERYKEQIKTVYIDPPYNTGDDGFLYADNYQHSSWMSLLNDRLDLAQSLMNKNSMIFTSIDDKEANRLYFLLSSYFEFINNISLKMSEASGKKMAHIKKRLPKVKETLFLFKKGGIELNSVKVNKDEWDSEYNIFLENFTKEDKKTIDEIVNKPERTRDDIEVVDKILSIVDAKSVTEKMKELNIKKDNSKWLYDNSFRIIRTAASDSVKALADEKKLINNNKFFSVLSRRDKLLYLVKSDYSESSKSPRVQLLFAEDYLKISVTDLWNDIVTTGLEAEGNVELKNGKKPENLIERVFNLSTDKNSIILDFFAGSGTTPSVAHKMNKKYIAIEMGEYFDKLTLRRMKFTLNGTSGGITNKKDGGIFKYFKLESYEDTLNNLEFQKTQKQVEALELYPQAKEDYLLNYSLDVESQNSLLDIDSFAKPFDYKLKIATSSVGETKATNIDLVETFNYLLGLVVKRIEMLKGYLVVEGHNLKKEKILIIWRDGQSSDELNEFFKKMDWSVYDREFDTIYVNGDNNLDNLRKDEDHFKVKLIEQEFKKLMFGE